MSTTPPAAGPTDAEKAMTEVFTALQAQDLPRAMTLAEKALAAGVRHPMLYNLAAHRLELEHRYGDAVVLLEQGLELDPNNLDMLTVLGLCLGKAGRAQAAVSAFDTVLSARPDNAAAHHGKGSALERLGDIEGAERHYQAAADLTPDDVDALSSLSALLARTGRGDRARELAEKILAIDPKRSIARVALAFGELAAGDYAKAEGTLKALLAGPGLDPEARAAAEIALGDALDGQGRIDDAYAAYAAGNAKLQEIRGARPAAANGETHFDLIRRLTDWFAKAPDGAWQPDAGAADGPAARHVFIVSAFPRSGGSVLEQALSGHPDVTVVEGQNSLAEAEAEFVLAPGGLDRLAGLSPTDAARVRAAYWARVADAGVDPKGKTVVDRIPVGAATLGLIAALFPKAKVLFTHRDPRDVVLTTFRRPFLMNADLQPFTTLKGAADLYDATLRLAEVSREKLPLDVADVRYERLTTDPKAELATACGFLGLAWDDRVLEAAQAVAKPAVSGSPWRAYAAYIAPILPVLRPWLDRFGYSEA
jgi:tetratricopeptide (TPR) repeat protein